MKVKIDLLFLPSLNSKMSVQEVFLSSLTLKEKSESPMKHSTQNQSKVWFHYRVSYTLLQGRRECLSCPRWAFLTPEMSVSHAQGERFSQPKFIWAFLTANVSVCHTQDERFSQPICMSACHARYEHFSWPVWAFLTASHAVWVFVMPEMSIHVY